MGDCQICHFLALFCLFESTFRAFEFPVFFSRPCGKSAKGIQAQNTGAQTLEVVGAFVQNIGLPVDNSKCTLAFDPPALEYPFQD